MPKSSVAGGTNGEMRPSKSLSEAVRRRALSVSEKLASRGLGAFVWRKNLDRDLSRGLLPDITSVRSERRRCLTRHREADRIKASAALPPPPPPSASLRSEEEDEQESAFLLSQSRHRADIRLAAGRPKPIDMLLKSLDGTQRCALAAFCGVSAKDLEELREEITSHIDLDREHKHFWEAAKVMCDAEIEKAALGVVGSGARFLDSATMAEVNSIADGKSLLRRIDAQVATGEAKVVEYWEELAKYIRINDAKKYLEQYDSGCNLDLPFYRKEKCANERDDNVDAEEGSEVLFPVELAEISSDLEWRKPKYTARVRSGYEWNKYNRVHYDHDRPPPKIVKGYKFVIYYPDFAGKTPQYAIENDGGSSETCLIRFHAGWPYEDVAFRIVNKEWELSQKMGFRCTFDNGMLHLNFLFKRFSSKR